MQASIRTTVSALALAVVLTASAPARAGEFPPAIALSSLNGTNGFRLDGIFVDDGIDTGDRSGRSVAGAGDVNGDGFADFIIGAFFADADGNDDAGESYVVFGKAAGFPSTVDLASLDGTTGFRLDGIDASDRSGCSVAGAGDVNGDGFADLIIGAYSANSGAGESYVVFGKAGGFQASIDLANLNGSNGFRLDGGISASGFSVAAAGDVNGDGFGDVIIGAWGASPGGVNTAGESFVVFGKAGGFAAAIDLASLNGSNGFRLDGISASDHSGRSVAGAGDVNGDGFADLIIGAYNGDPHGKSYAGESYVVFGKAGGFAAAFDLASLNGSNGFRLDGVDASDRSGTSVAAAGDVNGDGFGDLIIGAPESDDKAGESYVVFGKPGGFAASINLSSLNGSNGFRLDGIDALDGLNQGDATGESVAAAGDINADGFGDIIIGAPHGDASNIFGEYDAGATYVVFGRAGGFAAAIDLASLNGANGFRLDGTLRYNYSGGSVAAAGDVDGDGFGDIIIGAPGFAAGAGYTAGASYVVMGRPPAAAVTRTASGAAQYISGGALADTLKGLGGKDRLEGRAGADKLDGGEGSDTASYAHAPSAVRASLASPGGNTGDAAGDKYTSIENLEGSRFGDKLIGNSSANRLIGGKGHDTETGGDGVDIFQLLMPGDSIPGAQHDIITDFNAGSAGSADKIDLSAIDAKTGVGGNQAFAFIGTAPFTGAKGQLRIEPNAAQTGTLVQGDVNGDKKPDFEILLQGFTALANLTSIDFVR